MYKMISFYVETNSTHLIIMICRPEYSVIAFSSP